MKKYLLNIILLNIAAALPLFMAAPNKAGAAMADKLSGRILLQVETNGEAWYVNPVNSRRYFLGWPADAFALMRELGLGVSEKDYGNFNGLAPSRLSGRILLRVEASGEAYYVSPLDRRLHYLGRPADAFALMRSLGLGITNRDLEQIRAFDPSEKNTGSFTLHDVPFTSQAPYAEWDNDMFQDGCEEASVLMAMSWVNNESLSPAKARSEIIAMFEFEQNQYGEYRDLSTADTARLIRDYYGYNNIEIKTDVTTDDLINELTNGNVAIAPMDGQKLRNPHFTPPGPVNHMLVIRGYDPEKNEFITNDPGTRHGELYRYDENILINAIRDYPTGHHEPNPNTKKTVIFVRPE